MERCYADVNKKKRESNNGWVLHLSQQRLRSREWHATESNAERTKAELAGREHERAMVNTDGEDCLDAVLKVLCGEDGYYSEWGMRGEYQ